MTLRGARSVLMVCTGNICRSPTMEAVFRARAHALGLMIDFDSAGTSSLHLGERPDPRSLRAAAARGYDLSRLRARPVRAPEDFTRFDRILAADRGHLDWLLRRAPAGQREKLSLLLGDADLPDPYYGEPADFEAVVLAVEAAADTWFAGLSRD